jgi:hypothetical protein
VTAKPAPKHSLKWMIKVMIPGEFDLVPIGPHTVSASRFEAHVTGPGIYPTRLLIEMLGGRHEVTEISIRAPDDRTPIRPVGLRRVAGQLNHWVESAGSTMAWPTTDEPSKFKMVSGAEQKEAYIATRRRRRITPGFLDEVASVWTNSGRSIQAVREHFVVGERTAFRYVQKARQAGLLKEEG